MIFSPKKSVQPISNLFQSRNLFFKDISSVPSRLGLGLDWLQVSFTYCATLVNMRYKPTYSILEWRSYGWVLSFLPRWWTLDTMCLTLWILILCLERSRILMISSRKYMREVTIHFMPIYYNPSSRVWHLFSENSEFKTSGYEGFRGRYTKFWTGNLGGGT